jgi:hypothetical protein
MANELERSRIAHTEFVRAVVANEAAWILQSDDGPAIRESQEDGGDVLQFWADENAAANAVFAEDGEWAGYAPETVALFDLLYRWLPGMEQDTMLAGTHGPNGSTGLQQEPAELEADLKAALPASVQRAYEEKLKLELAAARASKNAKKKTGSK